MLATEAIHTKAGVLANSIQAGTPILAWMWRAIICVDEAVPSLIALRTEAHIGAIGILAGSPVSTRRRYSTLVNVFIAKPPGVPQLTRAGKVQIVAGWCAPGAIPALVGRAWVHLLPAISPRVRQLADALVVIHRVYTRPTVAARLRRTVVDVGLAVAAGIPDQARA